MKRQRRMRTLAVLLAFGLFSTMTAVHEFGHLIGAPDHYGEGQTALLNANPFKEFEYSDNCIYGANKSDLGIKSSLTICDGCKAQIRDGLNP